MTKHCRWVQIALRLKHQARAGGRASKVQVARACLAAAFVTLTAVVALPLQAAAPGRPTGDSAGLWRIPKPVAGVLADRDHDGVSDGLQARLEQASPSDSVDVVVQFMGPGSAAAAQALVGRFNVRAQFTIIEGFAATMTVAQARSLAHALRLVRIEEELQVTTQLDGAVNDFGGVKARSAFGVNGASSDGTGVGVCVVDTGVDPNHEQLRGKVDGFVDYINNATAPYDDHGHGTHVASIAAGQTAPYMGVAPGARIWAAKVLDATGSGPDTGIINAIQWCVDKPAVRVISMSLGTGAASDGKDAMSVAVNNAVAAGKVVVVAAGNSGPGPQTIGSPGAAAGAITVAAVSNPSGDGRGPYLASFSSRGPTLDSAGPMKPDIAAPGVRIMAASYNTTNGYVSYSGTSMATPFVAGTVALMLAKNSGLKPDSVKQLLKSNAADRGASGADLEYGAGMVDVYRAVAAAAGCDAATCPPTAFPNYQRIAGVSVRSGGTWTSDPIFAAGNLVPLAVTVTIDGSPTCPYGAAAYCDLLGGWEWDPDLDAELIDGNGNPVSGDLTQSICMLDGEWCGYEKGAGRQETLYFLPPGPGPYAVRVSSYSGAGSFAVDLSGVAAAAPPPPPPPVATLHVADLDGQSVKVNSRSWSATVTITVKDGSNNPVANAAVSGSWSNGKTAGCTTGSAGACSVATSVSSKATSVQLNVTTIKHPTLPYDSSANTDPDGDSTGTVIKVSKPSPW